MSSTIEELIQQTTGKSFEEMTDAELIDLVNSTRNCYQILSGAAKARKVKREGKVTVTAEPFIPDPSDGDDDFDLEFEEEDDTPNLGNVELSFGD